MFPARYRVCTQWFSGLVWAALNWFPVTPQNEGEATPYGRWPGDALGLPQSGPGSLAPWSRRLLALFIDWGIASLISLTWFDYDVWVTLGLFVLFHVVLTGLLGVTIGKRLVRIQVVQITPEGAQASLPGPHWALVRTLLMLLIIPPLVISPEGRAAHDRIAGTIQLRM